MNQKQNTPKNRTERDLKTNTHAATGAARIFRIQEHKDTQIHRYLDGQIQMAPHTHTNEVTRHFNGHRSGAQIRNVNISHKDCDEPPDVLGVDRGVDGSSGWGQQLAQCLAMAMSFRPGNAENLTNDVRSGRYQAVGVASQEGKEAEGRRTHGSARRRTSYNAVDKKVALWMDVYYKLDATGTRELLSTKKG